MWEFRDLEANWARQTLLASGDLLAGLRLNWLADAELSFSPDEPGKLGLSLYFTDPFERAAAVETLSLPGEVMELENTMRGRFDLVPRTWLKLHLYNGKQVGLSQYFVIDASHGYPITTLRLGLRKLGLDDVSRIEPAFQSVLGQPNSLWAVIAKRDATSVRPRISCYVLASSVPDLLASIKAEGYATAECIRDLDAHVKATCAGGDHVYVSLDPEKVDALGIDFVPNEQTPRPPSLLDVWGKGEQRRYLKLRVSSNGPIWTLYRPLATILVPTKPSTTAKTYYDGYAEEIVDAFGTTYQAGPIVKGPVLAERLEIQEGTRVLDAGCGAGGPAMELARAGARVWGVTISPVQAELALQAVESERLSDVVQIAAADYHRLPFQAASFDRVMFMESIGYADLSRVAEEAWRVLAHDGFVYVKDPLVADKELSPEEEFELAEFDRLYGQATPTVAEVTAALESAGFEITTCRPIDEEVDTSAFHRRMFGATGLSEFGKTHYRAFRRLPVSFFEIVGRKNGYVDPTDQPSATDSLE